MEQKEEMQRKVKQHKVGERFENCKLIYEVIASTSCEGCSLLIEEENHCADCLNHYFEPCTGIARDDETSVIFVQVGEAND